MKSFEQEMLGKIEQVIVDNIPEAPSFELFMQSRYETVVQIIRCYEENSELLQFIMNSGNTASFQTGLCEKIKPILNDSIFPKVNIASIPVPTELIAMIFTSISLNLAQYAYSAQQPIDAEMHAQFLTNIMMHGPLKTFGFLPESIPNNAGSGK